jgi:hypothetical protein
MKEHPAERLLEIYTVQFVADVENQPNSKYKFEELFTTLFCWPYVIELNQKWFLLLDFCSIATLLE